MLYVERLAKRYNAVDGDFLRRHQSWIVAIQLSTAAFAADQSYIQPIRYKRHTGIHTCRLPGEPIADTFSPDSTVCIGGSIVPLPPGL